MNKALAFLGRFFYGDDDAKDRTLARAVAMSFAALYLLNAIVNLRPKLLKASDTFSLIAKCIVAVGFLPCLPIILARTGKQALAAAGIAAAFLGLQFLLFSNDASLARYIASFALFCLPLLVAVLAVRDTGNLFRVLLAWSRPLVYTVPILLLYVFGFKRGWFGGHAYAMGYGYALLTPSLLLMEGFVRKPRVWDLLALLFAMAALVVLASRGALLCVIVYAFLRVTLSLLAKRRHVALAAFIVGLVALYLCLPALASLAQEGLKAINMRSRSLRVFVMEGFDLSGREKLYRPVWEEILRHPFVGSGIGGDVAVLRGYVHNIVLELMVDFGIVIGVGLFLALLYFSFRRMYAEIREGKPALTMVLFCLAVPSLMFSGTLWLSDKFWFLAGLLAKASPKGVKRVEAGDSNP